MAGNGEYIYHRTDLPVAERVRSYLENEPFDLENLYESDYSSPSSVDLDESFQNALKSKVPNLFAKFNENSENTYDRDSLDGNRVSEEHTEIVQNITMTPKSSKSAKKTPSKPLRSIQNMPLEQRYANLDDTVAPAEKSHWCQSTDDSFLALERMCNVTMTQPPTPSKFPTAEDEVVNNLLNEFHIDDTDNQPKASEDTILFDVEEPTGLWDHTMLNGPSEDRENSPVKRIGQLRPSTIIEENVSGVSLLEGSIVVSENNTNISTTETCYTAPSSCTASMKNSLVSSNRHTENYATADDRTHGTFSSSGNSSEELEPSKTDYDEAKSLNNTDVLNSQIIEISDSESDEVINESTINLSSDSNKGDLDTTPNFNDTLERVEYFLTMGQKNTEVTPKTIEKEPEKVKPTVENKEMAFKKPVSITKKPLFHTPRNIITKIGNPNSVGRSPQSAVSSPGSSTMPVYKKRRFFDIESPVAAYIKNTPTIPVRENVQSNRNLLETSYFDRMARDLDRASMDLRMKGPLSSGTVAKSKVAVIPKKVYASAENRYLVDERKQVKIPGGDKIHKLIPNAPLVVRHEHCSSGTMKKTPRSEVNRPDDTIANLSLQSTDISILHVKDAKTKTTNTPKKF